MPCFVKMRINNNCFLSAKQSFTVYIKPYNESCGKSGETTVEDVTALIRPFFSSLLMQKTLLHKSKNREQV